MTQFKNDPDTSGAFHPAKVTVYIILGLALASGMARRFNRPIEVAKTPVAVVAKAPASNKKQIARETYQKEMQGCMSIRELDAGASNTCRMQANQTAFKKGLIDRKTVQASNALDVANYPKRSFGLPSAATEIYFATEGKESSKLFWGKE